MTRADCSGPGLARAARGDDKVWTRTREEAVHQRAAARARRIKSFSKETLPGESFSKETLPLGEHKVRQDLNESTIRPGTLSVSARSPKLRQRHSALKQLS